MSDTQRPLRRRRKTRVVATMGPASSSPEMLEKLFVGGVDVFRLNMSHGDHADKEKLVQNIRALEEKTGKPTTILADLQGPKLRISTFKNGPIELAAGDSFTLHLDQVDGDQAGITLPHKEIFAAMVPGTHLLLDDGKVCLEVVSVQDGRAETKVLVGGPLSDRKGVNVPNAVLPLAALTEKDRRDLAFALKMDVDWVALSFVQRADDVAEARKLVQGKAAIMSKIEKPAAVEAIEEILELSDGVMVARGDLGVEEPLENVPSIQKRIVRLAREAGKPVVVATQMLESMIKAPVPTRAEVSDVANAVMDGADAVMLSAESAVGDFPLEAVSVMDRIAYRVENEPGHFRNLRQEEEDTPGSAEEAITAAARQVAQTVNAKAIVSFTTSGATAIRAARARPSAPILTLTPSLKAARKLGVVWGLHTVKTKDVFSFEEMVAKSKRMAIRHDLAVAGDRIVVTAGVPFGTPGATNVLHIAFVMGNELDNYTP